MDWKKWKKVTREAKENYDVNKVISFAKNDIKQSKETLDRIMFDKKYVLFDLETSGLVERYPQDKNTERQKEQILQIAALACHFTKKDGVVTIVAEDKLDITVNLQDNVRARLDTDSVEYKRYLLHKLNTFLNDITFKNPGGPVQVKNLNDIINLPDDLRAKSKKFIEDHKSTKEILDMTGYKEENATASEKEALSAFLSFIDKYSGRILSGHNILNFDLKFVNQRASEYEIPQRIENIDGILDTLVVARNVFQPTLDLLEEKFRTAVTNINNQLKVKISTTFLKNEQKEIMNNIFNKLESELKKHPEEEKELAKIGIIYGMLLDKIALDKQKLTNPSTGYRTSSQGPLSNLFKIKTDDWHNALADIQMLSQLFRDMYLFLNFAEKYTGNSLSEVIITEVEPYQRAVTAKHPAAKKRLIGLGKNLDKSSPYKVKLSLKRGKSAPPGG